MITGETYYLETKINPETAMKTMAKLFKNLGVEAETQLIDNNGEITLVK